MTHGFFISFFLKIIGRFALKYERMLYFCKAFMPLLWIKIKDWSSVSEYLWCKEEAGQRSKICFGGIVYKKKIDCLTTTNLQNLNNLIP